METNEKILNEVSKYYTEKILQNGATPKGVDWNSVESQQLRFDVLSNVITTTNNFSVLDYGCGFGAMYADFRAKYADFQFLGYDISEEMITSAKKTFPDDEHRKWFTVLPKNIGADYVIASGIFNVRLQHTDEQWLQHILNTLKEMNHIAQKGFSFNVLTKYSDKEYMKDYLYYADPLFLFDFCKTHFSKNIALLHDYNLYEFTIIVRK